MKRILLIAAMLFASALYASAEYSRHYVTETVTGRDGMYCIRIDWDEKLYELEGDGNEGEIRNLKEDGNKRTFDVYFDEGYGTKKKVLSVVFVTEDKDTFTITTITPSNEKSVYKCSSKDPYGQDNSGSSSVQGKIGPLDDSLFGTEDKEAVIGELTGVHESYDLLIILKVGKHVDQWFSPRLSASFWNTVSF